MSRDAGFGTAARLASSVIVNELCEVALSALIFSQSVTIPIGYDCPGAGTEGEGGRWPANLRKNSETEISCS